MISLTLSEAEYEEMKVGVEEYPWECKARTQILKVIQRTQERCSEET